MTRKQKLLVFTVVLVVLAVLLLACGGGTWIGADGQTCYSTLQPGCYVPGVIP